MEKHEISAENGPVAEGGYCQGMLVENSERLLFVSGQIPMDRNGVVPESFEEQCRQVWANIEAQLKAADMGVENLVKVTTFLSDRKYADVNGAVRRDVLGELCPALTVIIADIYDESWLLEIEAIAAD